MKMKKIFPESLGQKRDFALYTAKYSLHIQGGTKVGLQLSM